MPYYLKKITYYSITVCLICAIFVGASWAENLRETPVVKAVRKVGPAVVNISVDYEVAVSHRPGFFGGGFNDPFFDSFFQDFFDPRFDSKRTYTSLGSGVIIDGEKGLILTNAHVIETEGEIKVTLQDSREFTAQIIGSDPDYDLAVLKIETKENLPAVAMGTSSDLMVGETVIAIGNPFGFSNTVTTGVISSLDRNIRTKDKTFMNLIQLDASINPGNSGGPLLNIYGELIGVNTAIYADAQGIGFAIPIDLAQKITEDLIAYGKVSQSWLGLIVQPVDANLAEYMGLENSKALMVRLVEQDSPAAKAGLKSGDIITAIDGKNLNTVEEYKNLEKQTRTGAEITLNVLSDKKTKTVKLTAVNYPDKNAPVLAKRLLGVEIKATPQNQGVSVSGFEQQSFLAQQGLRVNDVILGINSTPTPTPEILYETVIRHRQDAAVTLTIVRGNRRYVINVPFGY